MFPGTIVEKMRELYKIPTTDECRLLTNIGSDVAGIVLNDFSKSIYDIRKTHTKVITIKKQIFHNNNFVTVVLIFNS